MSYLKSIKKRFSFDVDKLKINWLKNLFKNLNAKNHGLKQLAWSQLLMGSGLTSSKINWLINLSKDLNTKNHGLKQLDWSRLLMGPDLTSNGLHPSTPTQVLSVNLTPHELRQHAQHPSGLGSMPKPRCQAHA
jgi:hypothetical protein